MAAVTWTYQSLDNNKQTNKQKNKTNKKIKKSYCCSIRSAAGNEHMFKAPLTHSHTMTPFDAPGKQAF